MATLLPIPRWQWEMEEYLLKDTRAATWMITRKETPYTISVLNGSAWAFTSVDISGISPCLSWTKLWSTRKGNRYCWTKDCISMCCNVRNLTHCKLSVSLCTLLPGVPKKINCRFIGWKWFEEAATWLVSWMGQLFKVRGPPNGHKVLVHEKHEKEKLRKAILPPEYLSIFFPHWIYNIWRDWLELNVLIKRTKKPSHWLKPCNRRAATRARDDGDAWQKFVQSPLNFIDISINYWAKIPSMECSHLTQSVKINPQFLEKLRKEKASNWSCEGET